MNHGFVAIPRDLLNDPIYLSYNQNFTSVLHAIIFHAAYADCIQDDNGRLVNVKKGQLLASYDQIAKWAKVSRDVVDRAIKKFCDDQKTLRAPRRNKKSNGKQEKTLLTVLIEGIFDRQEDHKNTTTATTTATRPRRDRDEKEQDKENKEDKEGIAAKADCVASLPFSKEKNRTGKRLTEEQQETLEWLLQLDLNTTEKHLRFYATEYSRQKLEDAYIYLLSESSKTKIGNPGGFFRRILQGKIIMIDKNALLNKAYAEKFEKENPELRLKYEKKCLVDKNCPSNEIFYHLPREEFNSQLKSLAEKTLTYA